MARTRIGVGKQGVGQPARHGILVEAGCGLQQLYTWQHTAILVLPATASGEQLFKHKGAVAHLVLVPAKAAEIAQGCQHGGCQHTARAKAGTCRNGCQQCDF